MNKDRARVNITKDQAKKILAGDVLYVNIPEGAKVLEIRMPNVAPESRNYFAEVVDVFFNRRKAPR